MRLNEYKRRSKWKICKECRDEFMGERTDLCYSCKGIKYGKKRNSKSKRSANQV